jgi:hypothetical protein
VGSTPAPPGVVHDSTGGAARNKPASIAFGLIGTMSVLISALRRELVRDGVRYVRWQRHFR